MAEVSLQTATQAVFLSNGRGRVAGRPRGFESDARLKEFFRLLAEGRTPRDAAREARIATDRLVGLLADPQFRRSVDALLDDHIRTAA